MLLPMGTGQGWATPESYSGQGESKVSLDLAFMYGRQNNVISLTGKSHEAASQRDTNCNYCTCVPHFHNILSSYWRFCSIILFRLTSWTWVLNLFKLQALDSLANLGHWMGFREAHDPSWAITKTPKSFGEDTAGVRPGKSEIGEPGKEAGSRYQKERKEWAGRRMQDSSQRPSQNTKVEWCGSMLVTGADVSRYIGKFYSMRTQLQAISLRIQVSYSAVGWSRQSAEALARLCAVMNRWCSQWKELHRYWAAWTDKWICQPSNE